MKILLVCDVPGWAFDITAKAIQKGLPNDDIDICYDTTLHGVHTKQYDHIHYMNWLDGARWANQVTAGVCSHNYHLKWNARAHAKLPEFKKLVCISKILKDKLNGINNVTYIPNGVDTELFKPSKNTEEFTIGWVGQKTSGGFGNKKNNEGIKMWDIKGYELILKPLIKRLNGKVNVKVLDNDYTNAIPHEAMPRWYSHIDCLICTSLYEGCPFPVLEAASSGKAIVSTKVGIVPELITHNYNGFIINPPKNKKDIDYIIAAFETYIMMLKTDEEMCDFMGEENRKEAEENWSWNKIISKWEEFFYGN